jgi:hypothetical protein
MGKKIVVDANGKQVSQDSTKAAFIYNEGDERLDKFRAAVKDRDRLARGLPVENSDAARATADEDGTVERVERKRA